VSVASAPNPYVQRRLKGIEKREPELSSLLATRSSPSRPPRRDNDFRLQLSTIKAAKPDWLGI
jgi:hypothetical protein